MDVVRACCATRTCLQQRPTLRICNEILSIIEATTVTGPAKNLLNFCRLLRSPAFCRDGVPQIEVSIVTFDRVAGNGGATANAFVAAARDSGITIDVITERFRFDRAVIKQLRDIVARRAPDVIQTHMIKSHFLVKLSGLGKQYPWIAYHHGYTSTDLKMQFYNQLNRWSLPSADLVIAVCGEFAKQLTASGVQKDRIRVRHNSVKPPRIISSDEKLSLRERFGIAGDERVLLAVGRLSREKGHADLIESIALLRTAEPNLKFRLVILGEGLSKRISRAQSLNETLRHRLSLLGRSLMLPRSMRLQMYWCYLRTAKARPMFCWKRWPPAYQSSPQP